MATRDVSTGRHGPHSGGLLYQAVDVRLRTLAALEPGLFGFSFARADLAVFLWREGIIALCDEAVKESVDVEKRFGIGGDGFDCFVGEWCELRQRRRSRRGAGRGGADFSLAKQKKRAAKAAP